MSLKVTILGCGSSGGVPRIGNHWGACDPANPRNHRRRCSILVQRTNENTIHNANDETIDLTQKTKTTSVLVDTSPDMRMQLLDSCTSSIDGVIYTHEHADHTHGIDDLRVIAINTDSRVNAYMPKCMAQSMAIRFPYCFRIVAGSDYPPILRSHIFCENQVLSIEGAGLPINILTFKQQHGTCTSFGLRFGNIAYSCDLNDLPDSSLYALDDLDVWIVDALRYTAHSSHFTVKDALRWIERIKPKRAILTNMHIDLDYDILLRELPEGVVPAYDGMSIQTSSADLPDNLYI